MRNVINRNENLLEQLKRMTPARVGIASIGGALPTLTLLDLQLGQARAREAVSIGVDFESLATDVRRYMPVVKVKSDAQDRHTFIRQPELGRRLDVRSRQQLRACRAVAPWDVTFVMADGLSTAAVTDNGLATLLACYSRLSGWSLSPVVLAEQGRVALGDDIAETMNSRMCVVLIGERPGLSVSNSLGAYVTWAPRVGTRDADRNCVSNIHAGGLSAEEAARAICWILESASHNKVSGTAIKNEALSAVSDALVYGQSCQDADRRLMK